jgi:hypothetical protein
MPLEKLCDQCRVLLLGGNSDAEGLTNPSIKTIKFDLFRMIRSILTGVHPPSFLLKE